MLLDKCLGAFIFQKIKFKKLGADDEDGYFKRENIKGWNNN